ncbi:2,4-dienoyl-CoA reductase [Alkalibacterium putridalgicola]|uniref:2,4-dienoyl-CoA reductase n=1 Tax=Alkalibacterium putridalgicola TaxID=426703 RepID=A0A1H7TLK8_9LACT|nr:NADH:flavin oxidoreductase/NADH oxidase family protein [Alkalibacterium putridalgicola]GEK88225.1 NADH oxidase [Alkalibacterium putridalgicola]SEL85455.1 2,4-dienoyl-CoA reductase [Alkalibacterium putridalgicola]
MNSLKLLEPLILPNGKEIKNRFLKSAMSETLANRDHQPTENHMKLYERWAEGGSGIVVTGNVMIDRNALGEPGNVVVEDERDLDLLKKWAEAGSRQGAQLWMQINHPGKQSPRSLSKEPVAPSAIPLQNYSSQLFSQPRALTTEEVKGLVQKYIKTASVAKRAGFKGGQIHGAHGYLVSQFLSAQHNQRSDQYGGSLENRMRFLMEIYTGMRKELGPDFSISVKLNASDFSSGGFSEKESLRVAQTLAGSGIDLIEISGGNYENPRMFKETEKDSEDIFFIDYAERLKASVDVPVVVTGGFRSVDSMEKALREGKTSMIGLARPLVLYPDLPSQIIKGKRPQINTPRLTTGSSYLDGKVGSLMGISYYEHQIARLSEGKEPRITRNGWRPLWHTLKSYGLTGLLPRR